MISLSARLREALEALVRNVTAERPRDMFREIPIFSGNPTEFTAWMAAVNRVREARQIPDAEAIAECASKLVGSAREWHERIGAGQATWAGWQTSFRNTFAPKMSMLHWYAEAERPQLPKEPVIAYILAKAKWLRQCPEEFEEARFVPFVIRGFSSSELRAALSRNAPVTIAGLLEAVNEMEQYQPVSLAFLRPSNTAPIRHAAPAAEQPVAGYDRGENSRMVERPAAQAPAPANQLLAPAAQAPEPTTEQQQPPAQPGPGHEMALVPAGPAQPVRHRVPRLLRDVQCFVCGNFGHLREYCPERPPGNGRAGPAGQARQ